MPGHALTEVALIASAAAAGGLLLHFLRQPVLVGYILAGALLGPSVLGLAENRESIGLLAELGVLMLLFVIGLELSLRGFKRVWFVALATAALQIAAALGVAWLAGSVLGWSTGLVLVVGFSLALSSTAVAIKILDDIGELRTEVGRTAVSVLIAQDLAVVPMLLIAGSFDPAGTGSLAVTGVKLAVAVGGIATVIVLLSRRRKVHLPFAARLGTSDELIAIVSLALCFAAASISGLLGLAPAYGAFLAGLIVGNSADRPRVLAAIKPIESALLMLFFVSIGLLLDLRYIWDHLGTVVLLVLLVTVGKTAFNIAALRLLGEPWQRAFLAGTVMGQVGEFSFVLAAAAIAAGLLGPEEYRMLVAVIALSLAASPFWLLTARRLDALAWKTGDGVRIVLESLYGAEVRASLRGLAAAGRATATAADAGAKGSRMVLGPAVAALGRGLVGTATAVQPALVRLLHRLDLGAALPRPANDPGPPGADAAPMAEQPPPDRAAGSGTK